MNSEKKRPVTVEDLLRLKRLERPAAEFWLDFDRQLRAKQLSALVEKRPWWHGLSFSGMLTGFRRFSVPLGAAAIVALTIVSMRVDQEAGPAPVESRPVHAFVPPAVQPTEATVREVQDLAPVAALPDQAPVVIAAASVEDVGPASGPVSDDAAASGFSRFIPLLGVAVEEGFQGSGASLNSYVDSTLNGGAAVEPVVSHSLLGASSRFESRAMPARATVEPLQQITPPNERRGHRILTAMVSMASMESAMRTTERAASRLSEEQLYDQIHRFGARGAGVNVKF